MGSTTTEGAGPGAAEITRGPGNNRNQFVSLLDAHIVHSGYAYPPEGSGSPVFYTITLPENLRDVPEKLSLLVAGKGFTVSKVLNYDGLVESFGVFGTKKGGFDYVVIKSPGGTFSPDLGYAP